MKAYLIAQDVRQIVETYGPNESIVSNCHVRVAFTPNHRDTCELLSNMAGTQTIQKATYTFSGKRNAPVLNHVTASVENVERPLITPDEVSRIRPAKKRGRGSRECIVAPGQMLIFVTGEYPILGTQMLYFLDPRLKAWSEIPPPEKLVTLNVEGRMPPQDRLIGSPRHGDVVPEVADTDELSEMEQAFIDRYREQKEVYDYAD